MRLRPDPALQQQTARWGKVNGICIAPCREHTSKALCRYGTCSQGVSQFHSLTEWTIPAFAFQPKLVLIYHPRRDGRLSWPWVADWLHTEINVRHRELNPDTVADLSTNRARRWLTSLIEANAVTTIRQTTSKPLESVCQSVYAENEKVWARN